MASGNDQMSYDGLWAKLVSHRCKNHISSAAEKKALIAKIDECGQVAVLAPDFRLCTLLQSGHCFVSKENEYLIFHLLENCDCPELDYLKKSLNSITDGFSRSSASGPIKKPTPISVTLSSDTSDSSLDAIPIKQPKILKMKIRVTPITVSSSSDSSDLSLDAIPIQKQKVLKTKSSVLPPPKPAKVLPEPCKITPKTNWLLRDDDEFDDLDLS